uniref:S-adenosyl-L-methionine-dependent methyltransferase n=1 Tax=Talaromyces marneffei PM1 TaxID=1077442 RepID=A0A093Y5J8_TALMA
MTIKTDMYLGLTRVMTAQNPERVSTIIYREGSYWGPNDEQDAFHQRVAHHLFTLVLQDRLYLAPIPQPHHVLDIGTGIGLWASRRLLLKLDLSHEGRELFDLIHIRCLYGSVKDWRKLYQQAFEHLVPGKGFIEQIEVSLVPRFWYTAGDTREVGNDFSQLWDMGWDCDSTAADFARDNSSDSIFVMWYRFWQECSRRTGKTWFVADQMASLIYEVGFDNVCQTRYMLPLFDVEGTSSPIFTTTATTGICEKLLGGYTDYPVSRVAEIARWFRQFWETGMEGWVLAWTADEAKEFVVQTKEAIAEQNSKVYYELVVVYGQRPLSEGEK